MLAVAVIGEHPDTNSTDVPKRTLWRPGDHQPMRERVAELRSQPSPGRVLTEANDIFL